MAITKSGRVIKTSPAVSTLSKTGGVELATPKYSHVVVAPRVAHVELAISPMGSMVFRRESPR